MSHITAAARQRAAPQPGVAALAGFDNALACASGGVGALHNPGIAGHVCAAALAKARRGLVGTSQAGPDRG
ncbi:hypothetical protein T5B8_15235 [Salinisphaera sp. T5B8]